MTKEFIYENCELCDRCIFEDEEPIGCGIIDDEGCVSTPLKLLTVCKYGYPYIKHKPKYTLGQRLQYAYAAGFVTILDIIDDKYRPQYKFVKNGTHGRFNKPYPPECMDCEEFDEIYEPYVEESEEDYSKPDNLQLVINYVKNENNEYDTDLSFEGKKVDESNILEVWKLLRHTTDYLFEKYTIKNNKI